MTGDLARTTELLPEADSKDAHVAARTQAQLIAVPHIPAIRSAERDRIQLTTQKLLDHRRRLRRRALQVYVVGEPPLLNCNVLPPIAHER